MKDTNIVQKITCERGILKELDKIKPKPRKKTEFHKGDKWALGIQNGMYTLRGCQRIEVENMWVVKKKSDKSHPDQERLST